jgi:hypothetical protein
MAGDSIDAGVAWGLFGHIINVATFIFNTTISIIKFIAKQMYLFCNSIRNAIHKKIIKDDSDVKLNKVKRIIIDVTLGAILCTITVILFIKFGDEIVNAGFIILNTLACSGIFVLYRYIDSFLIRISKKQEGLIRGTKIVK